MTPYTNKPLTHSDQLQLLCNRGLSIGDSDAALKALSVTGYFRLANYLRPMEADKTVHTFKEGATFENAVSLYHFDTALRNLVQQKLSLIEIAFRANMIHVYSIEHGAFWYLDMKYAKDQHLFVENLSAIDRELRRSKEDFIKEHLNKYPDVQFPPAWKTLELLSFGTLAKLYLNTNDTKIKKKVARSLGLHQHVVLESWIASLVSLRNCCAHHARIWNRNFAVTPNIPSKLKGAWIKKQDVPANKLYIQLCCIAYILNVIEPDNTFIQDIKSLIIENTNVDVFAMGFPSDWTKEPLWQ